MKRGIPLVKKSAAAKRKDRVVWLFPEFRLRSRKPRLLSHYQRRRTRIKTAALSNSELCNGQSCENNDKGESSRQERLKLFIKPPPVRKNCKAYAIQWLKQRIYAELGGSCAPRREVVQAHQCVDMTWCPRTIPQLWANSIRGVLNSTGVKPVRPKRSLSNLINWRQNQHGSDKSRARLPQAGQLPVSKMNRHGLLASINAWSLGQKPKSRLLTLHQAGKTKID
ncbi:hypothetical protein EGW08_013616 [Elysia chlorotica]|uniref:Uncharacterized protein n=1 Tax=Elysia chlorotica TaxID=188477 RepID=A0A3S1BZ01_ELYCH|nr:hypothetical protein EGW08_013616 [Elysia chlorotica]